MQFPAVQHGLMSTVETPGPFTPQAAGRTGIVRDTSSQFSTAAIAGLALPAVAVNVLETFASSLTPLSDEDVRGFIRDNAPTLGTFMDEFDGPVSIAGDVAGLFLPAGIAVKAVRSTSVLGQAATKFAGPKAAKFFSSGKTTAQLKQEFFDQARVLGIKGVKDFNRPEMQKLLSTAAKGKAKDLVIEGLAADAMIAATMNSSDFLFPDEFTLVDNLVMFGGVNLAIGAAGGIITRYAMRTGATAGAGSVIAAAQNPGNNPIAEIATNVVGQRDVGLTALAYHADDIREFQKAALQGDDTLVVANLKAEQSANDQRITSLAAKIAEDSPYEGITTSWRWGNVGPTEVRGGPEAKTILRTLQEAPAALAGTKSFERFDSLDAPMMKENAIKARVVTLEADIKGLIDQLNTTPPGKKRKKLQKKATEKQFELREVRRLSTVVNELDGTQSAAATRQPIWHDGTRKIANLPDGVKRVQTPDGVTIDALSDGRVELPNTIVPPNISPVRTSFQAGKFDGTALAKSVGLSSVEALKRRLRSIGDTSLPVSPEVRNLRNQFQDDTFTAYVRTTGDSEIALKPGNGFDKPITVSRDDIWGKTKDGTLLVEATTTQKASVNSFAMLNPMQRTAALDAIQATLERLRGDIDQLPEIRVTTGMHWTQADMLTELVEEFGDDALKKLDGIESLEDLQWLALSSKFREYQLIRKDAAEHFQRTGEATHWGQNVDQVARLLNLPGDFHPLLQQFEPLIGVGKSLRPLDDFAKNLEELTAQLKVNVGATPGAPTNGAPRLRGNMLNMPRDAKPIIGVVLNDASPGVVNRSTIRAAVAVERDHQMRRLRDYARKSNSVLVNAALEVVETLPELVQAAKSQTKELVNGLQVSSQLGKALASQRMRLREMPAGEAWDTITDNMDKIVGSRIRGILDGEIPLSNGERINHTERFNRLLDRGAEGDLQAFDIAFNAIRQGWDVGAPVQFMRTVNGEQRAFYQLGLKDTTRNRQLWSNMFPGQTMPSGALLPTTELANKPVTLTQVAMDAVQSVNMLSRQIGTEVNTLRIGRNQRPVTLKEWHMPPRNLRGKEVVYLVDGSGKVKSLRAGATRAQAIKLAEEEVKSSSVKLYPVTSDSVERYADARRQAFFDMQDFSRPGSQTGPARGTSVGTQIEGGPAAFREMIEQLMRQYSDVARETRLTLFNPEVQYLKYQNAAAGLADDADSSYNFVINRILGTNNLNSSHIVGTGLRGIETMYDTLVQRIFDKVSGQQNARLGARATTAEWERFNETLTPEFNPFNDFNEFVERTAKIKLPRSLRKDGALLNKVTADLAIRILDVGMGIINLASLGATLPPVIHALKRGALETEQQHLRRIGGYAITSPGGLATLSPIRTAIQGAQFRFSAEGRAVAKRAKELGYLDQFAAERIEIYSKTGEDFVNHYLNSAIDKLSVVTDKTEIEARAISFMTMYKVGRDVLGIQSERGLFAFAHQHANQVIGDFRPTNRPILFQGAAGMPLGLFTTYMWNYLQRVYRMVESSDMKGLVNQAGLQAALFGAESVPGVPEYLEFFGSNYDGTTNMVDLLNEKIGYNATEIFLNGSLQSIPKMFGSDDSISIAPRAAIGVPSLFSAVANGNITDAAAGFRTIDKAFKTSRALWDSMAQEDGLDPGRAGEIIAQMNMHKFTSNMIELAQGHALDTSGNLIEQDTRQFWSAASRVAGFKPMLADELRQENRRNRTTDRLQNNLKERLGASLKSKVRRGKLTNEDVEKALADYMTAGGNPENFRRYVRSQIIKGGTSKLELEIEKALRRSMDENRLGRLLFLAGDS